MIDPRVAGGLRDLGPDVAIPRERFLATFRTVFASFGFLPIETPHIERMEVLTGKGAGSDEVLRQIFEVTNKGGERGELALRFDLTVPLARFIAKHIDQLGVPFKRYAMGSVFRGERPAKGRFREFTQCDFDTLGTESVVADAETAIVIHSALARSGVPPFTIAINDRRVLSGVLEVIGASERSGAVLRSLDKLSKAGREKVYQELTGSTEPAAGEPPRQPPLSADQARRLLDFVGQGRGRDEPIAAATDFLSGSAVGLQGLENLKRVLELIEAGGVPREAVCVDLGLARGLDYYTGIIFETTVNGWERYGSVSSGGRYDNLASLFTSRKIPGVGASIGLDRLLALLEEAGAIEKNSVTAPVLIVNFAGTPLDALLRLAAALRSAGIGAEVFPDAISPGKQLGYGSSRGHKFAVIMGPDEYSRSAFNLRNLTTREERKGEALAEAPMIIAQALGRAAGAGETP